MKKLIHDNFDKCLMAGLFLVVFSCAIVFKFDWLATLARDAFLVMTALVGYRRATPQTASTTETGDVFNLPPNEDLTTPEAIGAVEVLKEDKF